MNGFKVFQCHVIFTCYIYLNLGKKQHFSMGFGQQTNYFIGTDEFKLSEDVRTTMSEENVYRH